MPWNSFLVPVACLYPCKLRPTCFPRVCSSQQKGGLVLSSWTVHLWDMVRSPLRVHFPGDLQEFPGRKDSDLQGEPMAHVHSGKPWKMGPEIELLLQVEWIKEVIELYKHPRCSLNPARVWEIERFFWLQISSGEIGIIPPMSYRILSELWVHFFLTSLTWPRWCLRTTVKTARDTLLKFCLEKHKKALIITQKPMWV